MTTSGTSPASASPRKRLTSNTVPVCIVPPIVSGLVAFGGSKSKHSGNRTIWESRDMTGCLAERPTLVHRAKMDRHPKGTDQADKDQEVAKPICSLYPLRKSLKRSFAETALFASPRNARIAKSLLQFLSALVCTIAAAELSKRNFHGKPLSRFRS